MSGVGIIGLKTISLQVGLEELIERLVLGEEHVNVLLLSRLEGSAYDYETTIAGAARFQNVREPEALSLRGRIHVFVRDTH